MKKVVVSVLAVAMAVGGAAAATATSPTRGGTILFRRFGPPTGRIGLYSVKLDGSDLLPLAAAVRVHGLDTDGDCLDDRTSRDLCFDIGYGRWSPDGNHVAFSLVPFGNPYAPVPPKPPAGLYIANADGSSSRRLVAGSALDPNWSPDGKQLVFVRSTVSATTLEVVTLAGKLRRLVRGDHPRWSPNGRLISFVREAGSRPQVWVIRPNGTGRRLLVTAKSAEAVPAAPAWSADSHWIAYAFYLQGDVHLVRPDGSTNINFTHSGDVRGGPWWAPTGRGIAYIAQLSCGVDPATGEPCWTDQPVVHATLSSPRELIDDSGSELGNVVWSHDASRLAVDRVDGIYVKTLGMPGVTPVVGTGGGFLLDWSVK